MTTTSVTSSANPSVVGQVVTLTATVSSGAGIPSGSVDFLDGVTVLGTATLDGSGSASYATAALAPGSHPITVRYAGDVSFATSTSAVLAQAVGLAATSSSVLASVNPSAFGQAVTFTATVAPVAPGTGTPSGSIAFFDGSTAIGSASLDASGAASLSTSALAVGSHAVTAVYAGDGSFTGSTSPVLTQAVAQAATTTSVTSSANPSVAGQPVTFTASVAAVAPGAGGPTGSVTFLDGATVIGSGVLDAAGTATLTTSSLSVGSHAITAAYGGDVDFVASTSAPATQVVSATGSTVTLSVSADPTVTGQPITFTALVTPASPGPVATGTVTFSEGATVLGIGALDATGTATATTAGLAVGGHTITASYAGDGTVSPGVSAPLAVTRTRASTTVTLSSGRNPSVFGEAVTYTAVVQPVAPGAGGPTGTVTFFDGATAIGAAPVDGTGTAAISSAALGVGPHGLSAVYAGDAGFGASTTPTLGQSVDRAATVASLTSASNPSVTGQPVVFTATVTTVAPGTGIAGGAVDLLDGAIVVATGTLDATGSVTFTTAALAVGPHALTVRYGGDTHFVGSTSSPLAQNVARASTAVALTSAPNPSVIGQPVTLTANAAAVAPGAGVPSGSIDLLDGVTVVGSATLDASGTATLATTSLGVGSHTLTARYSGDAAFTGATSGAVAHDVVATGSTVTLTASSDPSVTGQALTFTAAVVTTSPGPLPTGPVSFREGATLLGSANLDATGHASVTLPNLAVGTHAITADYAGDGVVGAGSSSPLTITRTRAATAASITSAPDPSVVGAPVVLTITVVAVAPGTGTPSGSVVVTDGATTVGPAPLDTAGTATISTTSLGVGPHALNAAYAGDAGFAPSTSPNHPHTVDQALTNTVLTSSTEPSVVGQPVTFTATVAPVAPGAGTVSGSVGFFDGAALVGTGTVDASGTATISSATLGVGPHSITASYGGDAGFRGSTSAVLVQDVVATGSTVTLSASADPTVTGEPVTFTAAVVAVPPGAVPTGSVTFTDGAATLGVAPLDAAGTAAFTTSGLAVGSHAITATYAGDGVVGPGASSPLGLTRAPASTTTALASSSNPSVTGEDVAFTVTVAAVAPGAGTPTGSVDLVDGTTVIGSATLDATGTATVSVASLAVGPHDLTATYGGDGSYDASASGTLVQDVQRATTFVTVGSTPNPAIAGQPVRLIATAIPDYPGSGTPTGTIELFDGTTSLGVVAVGASGRATLATSSLAVGPHTIHAVYSGDASFVGATSDDLSQDVLEVGSAITISQSSDPTVTGANVRFTAVVTPLTPGPVPTGAVRFTDNGSFLGFGDLDATGTATLDTAGLPVGAHTIAVRYLGDGTVGAGVSPPLVHTVQAAATAVGVVASASTSTAGTAVTFTATVTVVAPGSGWPLGDVTFFDGATAIGTSAVDLTGTATLTTSSLGVGSHAITARYPGDASFLGSTSAPVGHDVAAGGSTITASAAPVTYPDESLVSVTVRGLPAGGAPPTGTVHVAESGTELVSGPLDATGATALLLPTLGAGFHDLTVTYDGDATYGGSTTATNVSVDHATTSLAIASSANPAPYPTRPHITASVTSAHSVPTGAVDFYVDNRFEVTVPLDAAGTAAFDLDRPPGTYAVIALYGGDANHRDANAVRLAQAIDPSATTASLSAAPATSARFGETVVLTATIAAVDPRVGVPTGTVEILDGVVVVATAPITGTTATITTSALPVGARALTARYDGDALFGGSTSPLVSYLVTPADTTVTVVGSPAPSSLGADVELVATVTADAPGAGTPVGTVTFTTASGPLGSASLDALGQARITTATLPVGTTTVTASYGGSTDHLASTGTTDQVVDPAPTRLTLTSSVNPSVTGQPVTLTAVVDVPAPGPGPATGSVSFFRSGNNLLGSATLDAAGRAQLTTTSLFGGGGAEQLVATYTGDAQRAPSSGVRNQVIGAAATTVTIRTSANPVVVGQSVTITATVAAIAPGGGVPRGGEVTFTDGGATLATVPISNGVATIVRSTPDDLGAFPHLIGARYRGGVAAPYADSVADEVVLTVQKGTPTITLTSSAPSAETGLAYTLAARLTLTAGAPTPTGTVFIYEGSPDAMGSARLLGSGPVGLIDGPCPPPNQASTCQQPGFAMPAPTLAIGAHSLFAGIDGDSSYVTATSPPFTQTITPIPTGLVVTADAQQTLAGEPVRYTVHVRNTGAAPANAGLVPDGTLTFSDVTANGSSAYPPVALVPDPALPGAAVGILDHPAFGPAGTYRLKIAYAPAGTFLAQSVTLDHVVQTHDAQLSAGAPTTVAWGDPVDVRTQVTAADGSPDAPRPTGVVSVESSNGQSCQSAPTDGGCRLTFSDPGEYQLMVRFSGDGSYDAATKGPITVTVTKRAATIAASVAPTRPVTGEPVALTWQVQGPATGAAQVRLGAVSCPAGLGGQCGTTFPLVAAGQSIPVAVYYPGDAHWSPATFATTIVPLGCYPLPMAVYPSEAGTMAAVTPRNCNGQQGYLEGTAVTTLVTPAPPSVGVTFVPNTQYPSGRAGYTQTFPVGGGPGQATYATATFGRVASCVELAVAKTQIAPAAGSFFPTTPPNCPEGSTAPASNGTTTVYRYAVGTTVQFDTATFGAQSRFYGVRTQRPGFFGGVAIEPFPSRTLQLAQDAYIEGVFGPACSDVTFTVTGPGAGAIDTPRNCFDPAKTGWLAGTEIEVSARATSAGAFVNRWNEDWADREGSASPDPVTGEPVYRNRTVAGVGDRTVEVGFTRCVALQTEALGNGNVAVSDAPNCPGRTAVEPGPADAPRREVRWYKPGTRVDLTASPTDARVHRFGKWTGDEERVSNPLPITMDHDQYRRASFPTILGCKELTLETEPAGWGLVNARGIVADDWCSNGDLRPEVPAPGKSGPFVGGTVAFEGQATRGNPLVGFTLSHPFGTLMIDDAYGAGNLTAKIDSVTTATATFCQAVRPLVDLVGPDGRTYRVPTADDDPTKPPPAGAPPWAPGVTMDDTDFVVAYPAPNCPYRNDAWVVGTKVTFLANAAPEGYTFTSFQGAATSHLFAVDVTFEGDTPSKDLGVTYAVTCHSLTLSGNETTAHPKPNCPGADPEALTGTAPTRVGSYIGGTTVILQTDVPDGKVWLGWSGDVDQTGTKNPTWITMCPKPAPDPDDPDAATSSPCSNGPPSGDKTAAQSWRDKTTGEKIAESTKKFFTDVGNAIAVGFKKALGVIAGGLAEFLFGAPPLGVLSLAADIGAAIGWLLEKAGVQGAAKYMAYAQETITFMKSTLSCAGTWGLAASPDPPPPPPEVDDEGEVMDGPEVGENDQWEMPELSAADLKEIIDLAVDEKMAQVRDDPDGLLREKAYKAVSDQLRAWQGLPKKRKMPTKVAMVLGAKASEKLKAAYRANQAAKQHQKALDALFSKQVREAVEDGQSVSQDMIDAARAIDDKAARPIGSLKRAQTWATNKAKSAQAFKNKYGAKISKAAKGAAGVGFAAYTVATNFQWENDAKNAWTNGAVYKDCIKDALPSYLGNTDGLEW